jgi:hypothetical protein
MKNKKQYLLAFLALGLSSLMGCENGDQLMRDKAGLEGEIAAKKQIQEENENLEKKSKTMEEDLSRRHRFFQALKGTFEGKMKSRSAGGFNVKFIFVPSLPPYNSKRIRQLEEISSDLNGLYFTVQVVQWSGDSPMGAVGCRVENVRPNLGTGEVSIASEGCPNVYLLKLDDASQGISGDEDGSKLSHKLAEDILDGHLESLSELQGQMHPSTNAVVYNVNVKKAQ